MLKINTIGVYRVAWSWATQANTNGLLGSTSSTLSTFAYIFLCYDAFNNVSNRITSEFILNVTTVPYYIFPGLRTPTSIASNDPWFSICTMPTVASINQ